MNQYHKSRMIILDKKYHHKTGMGGPVDVAGLNGEELVKKLQNDFASAENYEYLVQRVTKVENYIGDITSKVNFELGTVL